MAAIEDGLNIKQACIANGIHPRTFYDWRIENPDIEAAFETARETCRQRALAQLKRFGGDDYRALLEWLRLSYAEYRYGNGPSINVSAGVAVEITDLERAKLIERRELALSGQAEGDKALPSDAWQAGRTESVQALPAPAEAPDKRRPVKR
jgi:hypothetical protein